MAESNAMEVQSNANRTSQGQLVDRLMARIGELESQLYQKELLTDGEFTIPAIHGEQ